MPKQTEHMLDNILAMRVAEETTSQEVAHMTEAVRRAVMDWGKIRLLVVVEGFRHMDPDALLEKLSFLTAYVREIERMALVCRRVWIKAWLQAGGLAVPHQVRVFDASEERDAWQWIRQ
jgi:SpoIIAA-like